MLGRSTGEAAPSGVNKPRQMLMRVNLIMGASPKIVDPYRMLCFKGALAVLCIAKLAGVKPNRCPDADERESVRRRRHECAYANEARFARNDDPRCGRISKPPRTRPMPAETCRR